MTWWIWLLIGAAAATAVAVFLLRSRLRYAVQFARLLVKDPRIPKPLRVTIGAGLAVKLLPVPDFGIDEILLGAAALILLLFYRPVLADIHNTVAGRLVPGGTVDVPDGGQV